MAFTPEQLIEGFRSASQGGQVTELYNALRDFRLDIDRQKLSSMSDTDLKRLWVEMGADPIRGQLSPKQRRGIIEGMSDRFKKQQKIITRDIQNAQGTGTFAENHRKDLQKTVEKYIKGAAALETAGLLTKPFSGQIAPLLGSAFDPAKQVAAEQARVLEEGAKVGAVPGGPAVSATPSLEPLPVQLGEREAMLKRYTDSGYSQAEAQQRVDELLKGRQSSGTARQFYRVGGDIFEAGTGRHIGPTEWNRDWTGRATEVTAPKTEEIIVDPAFTSSDPAVQARIKEMQKQAEATGSAVPVTSTETAPVTGQTTDVTDISDLPQEMQDAMAGLTPEQQQVVLTAYNALKSGDAARLADADKALSDAIKLADPYFKSQLRLAQDEIQRATASTSADAASQVGKLQTRVNQLNEDLTFNREQLTLEEQATLASQLRQYKQDLSNLQTQYTEAGLAFSSPRQEAERQLAEQQREVAESTRRQTMRSLRNVEVGTLRDVQEAGAQLADVTRKAGEQAVAISRAGEQKVGSAKLPEVPGVTPLGDVTGSIAEDRQNAILNLEQTLLARTAPTKTV